MSTGKTIALIKGIGDSGGDAVGVPGKDGVTFIPSVNDGILSWENNGGLENPSPVNVIGPEGPQGPRGEAFTIAKVYGSVAEMNAGFATDGVSEGQFVVIETGDVDDAENARLYIKGAAAYEYVTDLSGAQGLQGPEGPQGISATHSWNGTTLTVTSASGTSSADLKGDKGDKGDTGEQGPAGANGAKGDKGDTGLQGPAGYSPVRGTDYWTAVDIAEIKGYVDSAILNGSW